MKDQQPLNDWRSELIFYLKNPLASVSRLIKTRFLNYVLIDYELYKPSYDGILLKFLGEVGALKAMAEVYERFCSSYQAGSKLRWTLLLAEHFY